VAGCECGWRGTRPHPPTEAGWERAIDQWVWEHAEPELVLQATRRRHELGRVLAWLGDQAARLEDPAVLERVGRTLDRARGLAGQVQRDLERPAPEREADGER
jgi:hypothetical protein